MKVSPAYDASARTLTLKVAQHIPPTPGQSQKAPVPIPLAVGLLASDGSDMPLHLQVCIFRPVQHYAAVPPINDCDDECSSVMAQCGCASRLGT